MFGKRTLVLQIRTNRTKDTWKQAISTASVDKVAAMQDELKAESLASSRLGPPSVLKRGFDNALSARGNPLFIQG